jgi:hypothetical protein
MKTFSFLVYNGVQIVSAKIVSDDIVAAIDRFLKLNSELLPEQIISITQI